MAGETHCCGNRVCTTHDDYCTAPFRGEESTRCNTPQQKAHTPGDKHSFPDLSDNTGGTLMRHHGVQPSAGAGGARQGLWADVAGGPIADVAKGQQRMQGACTCTATWH
jgi:hypothetical protein